MSSETHSALSLDLPALPDSWSWRLLSDLVDPARGICYGIVQPGKHDPHGIPMVNTGDVFDGHVASQVLFRVSQELHSKFRRSTLRGGELLVTLVGANFGRVAIAPAHYSGNNCSRAVGVVPLIEDAEYVMFALRSPLVRHLMDTWANTTAQPTFNLKDLGNLPVPVPPSAEKKEIKDLLKSFDNRIALLRETNATLEAIAQALFKSWFVDFDPVRAKASLPTPCGRGAGGEGNHSLYPHPNPLPEGEGAVLPPEIAALFPDSFEESELGLVPKGWLVSPIGNVVETVGGGTPDTKEASYWEPAQYCWTTPKDLSNISAPVLLDTERKLSAKGVAKISSGLLPSGTLLMSSRAPIGYLAITQEPMAINQGYIAMLPDSVLPPLYMLFWCKQNMDRIKNHANGSTFMEISKKAFRPLPTLVPPAAIIEQFVSVVGVLFDRLVENENQARTLATLRDTLLPRLISGQLRLPEASANLV
jgi:type I restriction enzyme S subunit